MSIGIKSLSIAGNMAFFGVNEAHYRLCPCQSQFTSNYCQLRKANDGEGLGAFSLYLIV